jgi:SHS2 domain-containing protein
MPSQTTSDPETGFFKEIEHTADLALRCGGPDLESLFRSAARGMYHLMGVAARESKADTRRMIRLAAEDVESLLVDWLGELAYMAEAGGLIFQGMTFEILTPTRLEAMLAGGRAARIETLVKAVTYHRLKVARSREGFTATVVFDV